MWEEINLPHIPLVQTPAIQNSQIGILIDSSERSLSADALLLLKLDLGYRCGHSLSVSQQAWLFCRIEHWWRHSSILFTAYRRQSERRNPDVQRWRAMGGRFSCWHITPQREGSYTRVRENCTLIVYKHYLVLSLGRIWAVQTVFAYDEVCKFWNNLRVRCNLLDGPYPIRCLCTSFRACTCHETFAALSTHPHFWLLYLKCYWRMYCSLRGLQLWASSLTMSQVIFHLEFQCSWYSLRFSLCLHTCVNGTLAVVGLIRIHVGFYGRDL